MQARHIMTVPVTTVAPDTRIPDVAKLLCDKGFSAAPVVDAGGLLIGIVSEGDLLRRPETATERHRSWWLKMFEEPSDHAAQYVQTHGLKAADVMTRKVVTVRPDTPVDEIAGLLEMHGIKRVPVVEGGKVVGIVSRANIVRCLASRSMRITPPSPADGALRERLLKLLEHDDLPAQNQINPIVENGVIHLWGVVDSAAEREAVRVAAETIAGARSVENHLSVRGHATYLFG